jgi:hypothetical protein
MTYPDEAPREADYLMELLEQVTEAGRRHGDCLGDAGRVRWQRLERRLETLRNKVRVTRGRVTDAMAFDVNRVTREALGLLLEAARARATSPSRSEVDLPS